jgi:hypothetical protein
MQQSSSFVAHLKLGIFSLGFLEDRDVGVGVFPEGQEILCRLTELLKLLVTVLEKVRHY